MDLINLNEEHNNDLINNLGKKLEESATRDKKGKAALAVLLVHPSTISAIETLADRLSTHPITIAKALVAAHAHYRSGQSVSAKTLADNLNIDELSARACYEYIIPLLIDLNILIRHGERSLTWQEWDKVGQTPSILSKLTVIFTSTPEQQAVKAAANKARAEYLKLKAEQKSESYARQRLELSRRQQLLAAELAQNIPPKTESWLDNLKQHPAPVALIVLLTIGLISTALNSRDYQAHQVQPTPAWAAMPTHADPLHDPRITGQGE